MGGILISIQPKWCEKIANGEKTIEVRKTRPKIETPFKVYIYCTKGKVFLYKNPNNGELFLDHNGGYRGGDYEDRFLSGKVIGEFVCDRSEEFTVGSLKCDDIEALACLSHSEIIDYFYKPQELDGKTVKIGYGWHISELKIYDKPKELSEFKKAGFMTEEQWLYALYPNTHCHYAAWVKKFEITRPPRSWCYVEELED